MVDLDWAPLFIDRVEDAVPPGPKAPHIRRSVRERLRRGLPLARLAARAGKDTWVHGLPGEVYNCGGPDECDNLTVVQRILELTGQDESLIEFVTDRPGHDRRYSLSSDKLNELGWHAQVRFADGLERTVEWYRDNAWWWEPIRSGVYREYYERQYGRALTV